jgi:hypothetical protein
MSYNAELRITDDSYPGVHHPAVKRHACPTCGAPRGEGCRTFVTRLLGLDEPHTRTHATRLNRWRVAQDRRRAQA